MLYVACGRAGARARLLTLGHGGPGPSTPRTQLASVAKGKELEGLEMALRLYNEPEFLRRYMPRR